jgi:cytochrome c
MIRCKRNKKILRRQPIQYLFVFLIWMSIIACNEAIPPSVSQNRLDKHTSPELDSDSWPVSFGFGRPVKSEEIQRLDIDIRPDGKGLPVGKGTAKEGKSIYVNKCASCHGMEGEGGAYDRLVGYDLPWEEAKTIGNYWPYATTLYDYLNRAMPFNAPGSLTPDEIYSLTAFLLAANKIIDEDHVMDSNTLPKVVMPAQQYFVPDDRRDGKEIR